MSGKVFYDIPASEEWHYKFGVLFIKKDHRRILNAQPRTKEAYRLSRPILEFGYAQFEMPETRIVHDFKILSN